jgi:hypothetical protein
MLGTVEFGLDGVAQKSTQGTSACSSLRWSSARSADSGTRKLSISKAVQKVTCVMSLPSDERFLRQFAFDGLTILLAFSTGVAEEGVDIDSSIR